jgi:arylsulfatase
MFSRRTWTAIALVAVGALLGYAAAAGHLSFNWSATAAPPDRPTAAQPSTPAPTEAGCCSDGLPPGAQLVRAGQKEDPPKDGKKPNILVIWGNDIGISNLSCYSDGLMGYTTPHIDRIAKEGVRFLHYYGEQSCTAGRAAFLTGQHGLRTGLTKVGFPSAPMGMSQLDPSIGGLLKNLGYSSGQFGKNHVGDRERLRRVLRQPLPPERRGGARATRLPERPGLPGEVWPARRDQV